MCACVRIIASARTASGASFAFFWRDSSRRPWNMPQSTRMRPEVVVTRCMDPVTVWAAPRNLIRMANPTFPTVQSHLDESWNQPYVAIIGEET